MKNTNAKGPNPSNSKAINENGRMFLSEVRRMRELAGIISEAKVENSELEAQLREFERMHKKFHEAKKEFMSIEAEFKVSEDIVRKALESIDDSEEKILELEEFAVRIKQAGHEKKTLPYKEIAETLYSKVNSTLKALIDELMISKTKVHEVKSSIELKRRGLDESLSISSLMSKAGEFVNKLFSKLGDFLKGTNSKLDEYIGELKNAMKDSSAEQEDLFSELKEGKIGAGPKSDAEKKAKKPLKENIMTGVQMGMNKDEQGMVDSMTKGLSQFTKETKKSSEPNMVNQYTWKSKDGKEFATLYKAKDDNSNIAFFYRVQVGKEPPLSIPSKPENWKNQLTKAIGSLNDMVAEQNPIQPK